MAQTQPKIRDILQQKNIAVTGKLSTTTIDDVAKQLAPLTPNQALFGPILHIGFALGKSLGLKSVGNQQLVCNYTYPEVIVGLVLAIQQEQLDLRQMIDTPTGAYFEIALPVDVFSVGGLLTFTVTSAQAQQCLIQGKYEIQGQKFSWGKGDRALKAVLSQVEPYIRRIGP